jgi:3',5'-nucleoside bisphosphate phosphatase
MQRIADLHIHTFYSDSTSSPEEVVADAVKAQLTAISITDHDVLDGISPTIKAAEGSGIEVIPGIELSSEIDGKDIHILGYFIDHEKSILAEKCQTFLDARVNRMKQMLSNLKTVGVNNIEYEEVQALTKSRAVGRAHLATLLVQKGWATGFKDAFERYIGEHCPGWAPKFKQSPFEAIDLIHQSGGLAVMAHPMLTQKDELISPMVKAGLDGLEVHYPNCSETVTNFYQGLARKHGLFMTGGSDAHGAAKSYTYVGKGYVVYETVEAMKVKCQK